MVLFATMSWSWTSLKGRLGALWQKKVSVTLPGFILLHLFGHHHQKLVKLNCPIPVLIHLIDHISEFSLCWVLSDKVGSPTCSISIPRFFLKGSPLSIFCLYWFLKPTFHLHYLGTKKINIWHPCRVCIYYIFFFCVQQYLSRRKHNVGLMARPAPEIASQ